MVTISNSYSTKKITLIGYIGEGLGDFLNDFNKQLLSKKIDFEVLQIGIHNKAFNKTSEPNYTIYKYDNVWEHPNIKSDIEAIIDISDADLYILCSGYHDFYARMRKIIIDKKKPYLLYEASSIKSAYLFDLGLHGDSNSKFILKQISDNFKIEKFDNFIKPRYLTSGDSEVPFQISPSQKKMLYLGIWDDAAGFNSFNDERIQNKLSSKYRSNFQAIKDILSHLPENWTLIVKPHPATQNKKLKDYIVNKKNTLWVENDTPLLELIKASNAVITITSTTSILATYLEKPLLMLGNSYVNQSYYSYNISDYKSIKEAIFDLTNKIDWSVKKKKRELFFESYIKSDFLYSHSNILNKHGIQKVEDLVGKINKMIDSLIVKKHFKLSQKSLQLLESSLLELSFKREQLNKKEHELYEIKKTVYDKDQQLNEIKNSLLDKENLLEEVNNSLKTTKKTLQKREVKLSALHDLLNKYNIIFKKVMWYSSFKKNWRRNLRTFKKEFENQLNL